MALRADGELSSQLPQLPTPVPRGIDFVPQMLALMGMSPRDSKCSVGFIPFLDMIKLLLPQAEDWPSLQRQLKSELFTKLHKREDLSSPFSPREDNLRSGGLYYSFLAINYAIQMPVKASLHAVAGVIKLDTWGQMPLFPDPPHTHPEGEKDEKATIPASATQSQWLGRKWGQWRQLLCIVHAFLIWYSPKMDLTICIRSSDPQKPALATWKPLECNQHHPFDSCHYLSRWDVRICESEYKVATHLERVCWSPLSLVALQSWYFYVSAWRMSGQLLEVWNHSSSKNSWQIILVGLEDPPHYYSMENERSLSISSLVF